MDRYDPTRTRREMIFEPLYPDVPMPERATAGSAAYDLKAYLLNRTVTLYDPINEKIALECENSLRIPPSYRAILPLGFKATLPSGTEGRLSLRSSVGLKKGLIMPNSPGVVDEDYESEWGVLVLNVSDVDVIVEHGERVAQVKVSRYETPRWIVSEVVPTTTRRGGHGSTGKF